MRLPSRLLPGWARVRGLSAVGTDPLPWQCTHMCRPMHTHMYMHVHRKWCTEPQQHLYMCTHRLTPHYGAIVIMALLHACMSTVIGAHFSVIHPSVFVAYTVPTCLGTLVHSYISTHTHAQAHVGIPMCMQVCTCTDPWVHPGTFIRSCMHAGSHHCPDKARMHVHTQMHVPW